MPLGQFPDRFREELKPFTSLVIDQAERRSIDGSQAGLPRNLEIAVV